ncbi:hypothetical protein BgAZ_304000 [Babesia gibsoni]|uniref:5'-3' DNA helicase ZGRF1-like N-terminal domain-containing protein n=1 Tax=Babesia gibsoni TaxID=33632 RepID=A0AAD8LJV0_BABGI|nr:hypothetical protein BgAZ_304000 [Babesia gibsoni]
MQSLYYECLFTRNSETKKKKWRDGVLNAQATLRFVRVALYEVDERDRPSGTPIDNFEIFTHKYDGLSGEVVTSPRFIVSVLRVKKDMNKYTVHHPIGQTKAPCLLSNGEKRRNPALGTRLAFAKYRRAEATDTQSSSSRRCIPIEELTYSGSAEEVWNSAHLNNPSNNGSRLLSIDASSHTKQPTPEVYSRPISVVMPASPESQSKDLTSNLSYTSGSLENWPYKTSNQERTERIPFVRKEGERESQNNDNYRIASLTPIPSETEKEAIVNMENLKPMPDDVTASITMTTKQLLEDAIYNGIIEDFQSQTTGGGTLIDDDVTTIVDPALIDCIESALGHFDDFNVEL